MTGVTKEIAARKTMNYEYTKEFPNLLRVIEIHGPTKSSRLLGLSDVNKMVHDNKVRPAYEMAAAFLLRDQPIPVSKSSSMVIKMNEKQRSAIVPILEALQVPFMDLDL